MATIGTPAPHPKGKSVHTLLCAILAVFSPNVNI